MESEVRKIFDARILHIFKRQPNLLKFFLNHEKKTICINNLCFEIRKIELRNSPIDAPKYQKIIESIADLFCRSALNAKEKEMMSAAELKRLETEASKLDQAREEIKEMEADGLIKAVDA